MKICIMGSWIWRIMHNLSDFFKKNSKIIIVAGALVIMCGIIIVFGTSHVKPADEWNFSASSLPESDTESQSGSDMFCVYVCGQVKNPGVYNLDSAKRIADAIEAAGGALKDAELNSINLADKIEDGERIFIPKIGENDGAASVDNSLVNINTADMSLLQTLPGIGEARARAIVDYRTQNGNFKKIDDITKVAGIKDAAYAKIKDLITI